MVCHFSAGCDLNSSDPAMSIIGAEDEDFENDLNDVSDEIRNNLLFSTLGLNFLVSNSNYLCFSIVCTFCSPMRTSVSTLTALSFWRNDQLTCWSSCSMSFYSLILLHWWDTLDIVQLFIFLFYRCLKVNHPLNCLFKEPFTVLTDSNLFLTR